jgi:hypothetical protein
VQETQIWRAFGKIDGNGPFLKVWVGKTLACGVSLALFVSCSSDAGKGGEDAGIGTNGLAEPLTASEWPTEAIVATNSIWLQDRAKVKGNVAATKAASQWLSSNSELVVGPQAEHAHES